MLSRVLRKGSVLGGILLISGSSIGAGMLGLPLVTGVAGFYPSIALFIFCWAFMTSTGYLFLEVNLSFGEDVHIVTIADKTLGKWGKIIAWIVYLFLFYCLLTAYVSATGIFITNLIPNVFNFELGNIAGSLLITFIFGVIIYFGANPVDFINRIFMFGLFISYFSLISNGIKNIDVTLFHDYDWGNSIWAIPIVITAFGFHNMIPTLNHYLRGNKKGMIQVIFWGSLISLVVYLLWEAVILGEIPLSSFEVDPTKFSKGREILDYVRNPWMVLFINYFAFFAITTSFLAQALSLVDFIGDGLKLQDTKARRIFLVLLVLAPPFFFSISSTEVFLTALSYAGGFGAVILFAILPALMVWKQRYLLGNSDFLIIKGGKAILSLILLIALGVILIEFFQEIIPIKRLLNIL